MTRRTIEIACFCAVLLIAALVFHDWLASHDDQLRLQSTLASQKQILDAADARERDRNAALKDTLAKIDALKRQVQTPEQILRELPKYLPLPQPITMSPPIVVEARSGENRPRSCTRDCGTVAPAAPAVANSAGKSEFDAGSDPGRGLGLPGSAGQRGARLGRDRPVAASQADAANTSDSESCSGLASGVCDGSQPPGGAAQQGTANSPQKFPAASRPAAAPHAEPSVAPTVLADDADSAEASSAVPSPQAAASAEIPVADLKPLYDFVQDCRACQARLAASQQNATDNAAKLAALTRERDAALKSAKGGPFWLRLRRNVLWLALGAAASATAVCASGHCR